MSRKLNKDYLVQEDDKTPMQGPKPPRKGGKKGGSKASAAKTAEGTRRKAAARRRARPKAKVARIHKIVPLETMPESFVESSPEYFVDEQSGAAPADLPTPSGRSLGGALMSIPVNLTRRLFTLGARVRGAFRGRRAHPV